MNKVLLDRHKALNSSLIKYGQKPISKEKYLAHLEITLNAKVKKNISSY